MVKTVVALIVLVLLPACAAAPDWFPSVLQTQGKLPATHPLAEFSFDWELSGSHEVAPLQIFDDGQRTWLQFSPGQPVPAIFEMAPGGARLLSYTREDPYIVLPGVWQQLMFRGGALQGLARRTKATASPAATAMSITPALDALAASEADALALDPKQSESTRPPIEPFDVPAAVSVLDPVVVEAVAPVLAPPYEVSPQDQTLRAALAKWAGTAGWTFEPEHWALDVDIPIVGSASFALPFKQAVQELVASTELADRPLQPCFYSNRVLRVVPYAQSCNRTAGNAGVS